MVACSNTAMLLLLVVCFGSVSCVRVVRAHDLGHAAVSQAPGARLLWVWVPPSDTYGYPTRMRLHGDQAVGVVGERDAQLVVELGLVGRVGVGEHVDDVSSAVTSALTCSLVSLSPGIW